MSTLFENSNSNVSLEVEQNVLNKLTASKRRFFASKVHKLKKMLKPVLKLMSTSRGGGSCQESSAPVCCVTSAVEDIQNAMNEALEARLSGGDVGRPYDNTTASTLQALANGDVRLVAISCDGIATRVPVHFVCGRYSWTHVPSADNDISAQGDFYPMSFYQEAEQQTPHCDHSHLF